MSRAGEIVVVRNSGSALLDQPSTAGHHSMVRRPALSIAAALLVLQGCFSYLPIEPGEVEPGLAVRARVSPAASARIAPLLGASEARRLDGTVVTHSPDTLIVEVPTVMADVREFGRTPNQRVSIPRGDLLELEVRRLDRIRTSLVAGTVAAIIAGVLVKSLQGEPGKEPLPGGGGTDALVWSFTWRP
jgi:hypothetical protein